MRALLSRAKREGDSVRKGRCLTIAPKGIRNSNAMTNFENPIYLISQRFLSQRFRLFALLRFDMSKPFEATQITESVYRVGAVDWELRNFHGYETRRGSTYNAFLVKGTTGYILIDTVKKGFERELMSRIESVCDPKEIVAIISNHAEMDHSGSLPYVLERISPDAKVYASVMGVKALAAHFGDAVKAVAVAPSSRLEIAGRRFYFVETRMLHWPDSMWTFDETDRVLFSNDAFGMHLAGLPCWYDEYDPAILEEESSKYFANILMIYASVVAKLVETYPTLDIDPAVICPDHGPLWRGDGISHILGRYAKWSNPIYRKNKAVVVFDTMWHSTERMAHAIAEGLHKGNVETVVMPLSGSHRSDVAREMLDAKALIVGSPTLNQGMMPTVADVLTYLKGLKFPIDLGTVFGSYGWAPLGAKAMQEFLTPMCKNMTNILTVQYVPTDDDIVKCREYGEELAHVLYNGCTWQCV